jgi:lipopolysaccharide/colanic/teichoic acid biosynthesis glycosyltransferase
LRFDLIYLSRQGVLEDLKIMLKTVPVVLFKQGGW